MKNAYNTRTPNVLLLPNILGKGEKNLRLGLITASMPR